MSEQPLLAEETQAILHRMLDISDAGGMRLRVKCNAKETPELYDSDDKFQIDTVWGDLKNLAQLGIVDLKLRNHQHPGYQEFDNGKITLRYEAEETVRRWFERPAFDPQHHLWSAALNKHAGTYEDGGEALRAEVIKFPGKNYDDLAAAFAGIAQQLQTSRTLRQLSALCFWGESKFLEGRESLVINSFPSLARNIVRRPLLLSVYLPEEMEHILFIENQDTFLELVKRKNQNLGLVYLGGFRGTTMRVREPGQAVFAYLNEVGGATKARFEEFWWGQNQLPCFFWGDLDYAGISILGALKQVFPDIEAWLPGYQPLVELLKLERGHSHAIARKEKQVRPDSTGCGYADYVLLTGIDEFGSFIDQEAVSVSELDLS